MVGDMAAISWGVAGPWLAGVGFEMSGGYSLKLSGAAAMALLAAVAQFGLWRGPSATRVLRTRAGT
jgi:hypothetical protein